MINATTNFPVLGDIGRRPGTLSPVSPVYRAEDAPEQRPQQSHHRPAPDMSRLERIQQQLYGQRFFYERPLGARARQAISAYGAVKEFEDKEYVRAVMGVDEFA